MGNHLFAGTAEAEIGNRGQWALPGSYVLTIDSTFAKQRRTGGEIGFMAEMIVENASGGFVADTRDLKPGATAPTVSVEHTFPPGSRLTWYQLLRERSIALGAIKGFVLAALGIEAHDEAEIERVKPHIDAIVEAATGPENILCGRYVCLQTRVGPTKNRGVPFTYHNWSPFDYEGVGATAPTVDSAIQAAQRSQHGALRSAVAARSAVPGPGYPPPPVASRWPPGTQFSPGWALLPGATQWIANPGDVR